VRTPIDSESHGEAVAEKHYVYVSTYNLAEVVAKNKMAAYSTVVFLFFSPAESGISLAFAGGGATMRHASVKSYQSATASQS
jgi:hypothetical protein